MDLADVEEKEFVITGNIQEKDATLLSGKLKKTFLFPVTR